MERCISAFSSRSTERGQTLSFDDVYERLSGNGGKPLLIMFSSDFDNFLLLLPESQVIGMTSFYNYATDGGAEIGLSALAVYSGIECAGGVLTDAGRCPIRHISEAKTALSVLGLGKADEGKMCCIEFTTAYGRCEEPVLDTLKTASGDLDIPVFGSTAGARKGTHRSYVSLNGEVFTDACVFMYIRNLEGRVALVRENSYKHTDHFFQATKVDCENRTVYEFNGRPAAIYLSSIIGTEPRVLAENLAYHPVGRIYNDNIYISDGESMKKDGTMTFFSHIYNYSRVVLLEPDDPNTVSGRFFRKLDEIGFDPSFSLAVNCAFDFDIFAGKGFTEDIVKQLSEKAGCYMGVSGCGEQTDYMHVNKTMLLAAFE